MRNMLILLQNQIILTILGKGGNILRHFIEQYKEAVQQHPKEEYLKKNKPIPTNETDHPKGYPIKLISYLRCHYCNLDFHDVKERREHELEWHV